MRVIILILLISLTIGCKKEKDSFVNSIIIEESATNPTPEAFTNIDFYVKINENDEVFGYNKNMERVFTQDNFNSFNLFNDPFNGIYNYNENILFDNGQEIIVGRLNDSYKKTFKSKDKGASFSEFCQLQYDISSSFSNIHFINSNTGYYCNSKSNYTFQLHKICEGKDSIIYSGFLPSSYYVDNINFINELEGSIIVSGINSIYTLNTSDGGQNWVQYGPTNVPTSMSFYKQGTLYKFPGQALYYIINPNLMYSHDGGQTWNFLYLNNILTGLNGNLVSHIQFVNKDVGYAITSNSVTYSDQNRIGYLYKTIDGGLNWAKSTDKEVYAGKVNFVNENKGLVYSSYKGYIQKTNDGGKTFELLTYPNLK